MNEIRFSTDQIIKSMSTCENNIPYSRSFSNTVQDALESHLLKL